MNYNDLKHTLLTLPTERLDKINSLKSGVNIVGLSGGKDSLATCILLHWLDIPFRTITAEVWWKEGITGENPYHYEFMHGIAVPKLNTWGITCDFIRGKITAYEYMTTPIAYSPNHPDRVGKIRGFPFVENAAFREIVKQARARITISNKPKTTALLRELPQMKKIGCYQIAQTTECQYLNLLMFPDTRPIASVRVMAC